MLRRYRTELDGGDEARLTVWAVGQGLPVPRVHAAEGRLAAACERRLADVNLTLGERSRVEALRSAA